MSKIRSLKPSTVAAFGVLLLAPLTAGLTAGGSADASTAGAAASRGVTVSSGAAPAAASTARLDPSKRPWIRTGGSGDRITGRSGSAADEARKTLDVKFGPHGGTYGVGQPLTARLSARVTGRKARARVERRLRVVSKPAVAGGWYWVDGRTLHYRPRDYWPAHATVTVESRLAGRRIRHGLYGGSDSKLRITTGDRIEALVDSRTHHMTVTRNGKKLRTLPVTTGKRGFETRNGVKVVLSEDRQVHMSSGSIGIAAGSGDSYSMEVQYAIRVTWSGEYMHAAPWSVRSQGSANVSHGCTGMSTADARWYFDTTRRGDIVSVVNSKGRMMTPFGNGYGDWNLSWQQWRAGSALGHHSDDRGEGSDELPVADAARLRPQEG